MSGTQQLFGRSQRNSRESPSSRSGSRFGRDDNDDNSRRTGNKKSSFMDEDNEDKCGNQDKYDKQDKSGGLFGSKSKNSARGGFDGSDDDEWQPKRSTKRTSNFDKDDKMEASGWNSRERGSNKNNQYNSDSLDSEIIEELLEEFVKNPHGSVSRHPLMHQILSSLVHRNLVIRLRTGSVRQFLSKHMGQNYFEQVDELEDVSPKEIAEKMLRSSVRQRIWDDVKNNLKDNLKDQFNEISKHEAFEIAERVVDSIRDSVRNPDNKVGEHVSCFVERALIRAITEEIKDSVLIQNCSPQADQKKSGGRSNSRGRQ